MAKAVTAEEVSAALLEQARACASYDYVNGETTIWVVCMLAERLGLENMDGAIRRAYDRWCFADG